MAVCLILTLLPATALAAGEEKTITNAEELANAIANQDDGQTWYIQEGEYVLTEELLAKYADKQPGTSGQGGWYFPLWANDLTIIGQGDVVITSDVETANGVWATQDFVSVWGNNIEIDNVDILSKTYQNKAIEVMGQNFTLKNSEMRKVDENGSGSIIFNSSDIGTATLKNVKLYSWVSTNYSKEGTLNASNVTIDFTDNAYAGYENEAYGFGWCPGIFNNKTDVTVNNENLTIIVDDEINLVGQIFTNGLQSGTTIELTAGEYDLDKAAAVQQPVNIKGAGVDKTIINGSIGYTTDADGADISISGISMCATKSQYNPGINFSALTDSSIDISDCSFEGYLFGIGVNSSATGNALQVSDTSFIGVNCAAGVKQGEAKNSVEFTDVKTNGGYAIQSFASDASGYVFDGYYDSYDSYAEDLADGTLDTPDYSALGGSDSTVVTPGMDLQEVIDKASEGDTIRLIAGEYQLDDTLSITKRINLVGAGAAQTTIVGPVQYLFSEDQGGKDLTVSGITFQADSNSVQGLQFRGDEPNDGYNVKINVQNCDFDGWTYGITMNSHANGYDLTVSGCDFSESLYAVSYNFDDQTVDQQALNTVTFGQGNTIAENGFAVQKFSNNAAAAYDDKTYDTVEAFENDKPVITGSVIHVTNPADLAGKVANAPDGATIVVAPGTYSGNITFGGKSLTIKAQYPAYKNGVMEDESKLSKFTGTFNTSEGTDAAAFDADQKIVIEGFAFSGNGLKVGNTHYSTVGTLEVRNCTMKFGENLENEGQSRYQLNYFVKNSSVGKANVIVEDNYIFGEPVKDVFPLQLWGVQNATVANNVFELTGAENHQAIGVSKMAADAKVNISGNTISGAGGGIYVTTWLLDGNKTNAEAAFKGTVTVEDNILTCEASETMEPIFIGYETNAANSDTPYGTIGKDARISATGNTNNGSDVAAVIVAGPADETPAVYVVTVKDDGEIVDQKVVANGGTYTLPTRPYNPYYMLKGWSDGSKTYDVGDEVTITKDTVFTAQWEKTSSGGGSSSGGSSSSSSGDYAITVDAGKHGDVSVSPKRADKGDTVTITVDPDKGYEVDEVIVTDKDGDTIRVKDRGDGEYTFTMPDSKVTVEVTFVETGDELSFVDVAKSDYYYDAVKWAVDNGVTTGVTDTIFAPGNPCTRAQTVTFLWRAAGMPQAANRVNPFTDVSVNDYYYEAVLWAVENGITGGTTATTFSPNATCTRAQVVTFLWRYSKEDASILPMFTDVAESDYYYGAVAWAVENGVTTGVTDTTFAPGNPCTRGQIVTFLYRYMGK